MSEIQRVQDFAAADSPAERYALHQAAIAEARADAGFDPASGTTLDRTGDEFESCDQEGICSRFADFELEGDELHHFTVNGRAIRERLGASGETADFGAGTLEVVSSYQASGDHLFVVLEVMAGDDPLSMHLFSITYVDLEGRQRTTLGTDGPHELAANASALLVTVFRPLCPRRHAPTGRLRR